MEWTGFGKNLFAIGLTGAITLLSLLHLPASGEVQQVPYKSPEQWRKQVNDGTVSIITKGLGCTCTSMASDMSHVLNEIGTLRVLPVLGTGSLQGVADVLYLQGMDMSIVQADVLTYIKRNNLHPGIDNKIRYITKLHNSELHLIAGKDIRTIHDLNGKKVSYDVKGRGDFITAQTVFESFGVTVEPVHLERDVAIEKTRSGEIAAAFVVTGKPADSMRKVKPGGGLHFLPIEFTPELAQTYMPTSLTHEDYPNLVPEGERVPTVAVGEVLAVYNWPTDSFRYAKLVRFIDDFFDNFDEFHKPVRHAKWKEVNLAAKIPGWTRYVAAEAKLKAILMADKPDRDKLERDMFHTFVTKIAGENMPEHERDALYKDFVAWRQENR